MGLQFLGIGILTWITFLPILGMGVVLFLPKENKALIRSTAVGVTVLQAVVAVIIFINYNRGLAGVNSEQGMQFVEKCKWIDIKSLAWFGSIQINYFLGIDGLSVPMVLLTSLVCFAASIASFSIEKSLKGYFALFLLLDTGMMGVFVALDFFLFYVFWEVMLLPMYFLIGVWGGPRREYAAIKFFLYTLLGSVLMLLAMIALYFSTSIIDPTTGERIHTFNMIAMMNPANFEPGSLLGGFNTYWRYVAYVALFIGFAIKVPDLPVPHMAARCARRSADGDQRHPGRGPPEDGNLRYDAHQLPDLPRCGGLSMRLPLAFLGFINIVYGALCAMAQKDFKKLIAYSSISATWALSFSAWRR